VAGAFTDVFTVPAGQTVIVKDLRMSAGGVAMTRAAIFIRSGPHVVFIRDGAMGGADSDQRTDMFLVMEPGGKIGVHSAGGTFGFIISGAQLDGVAP